MNQHRHLFAITGLMALLTLAVTMTATWVFYNASIEDQRAKLTSVAKSQARIIETMARLNLETHKDDQTAALKSTLSQFDRGRSQIGGVNTTGEIRLGSLNNETVTGNPVRRSETQEKPEPQFLEPNAPDTPMQEALNGRSGSLIGLDALGILVLAAYEPITVLNLGVVAKISLAELRALYVKLGLSFSGIGVLMVLISSFLFYRIGQPIVQKLDTALAALRMSHDEQESLVEERTAELKSELTMRELIEQSLIGAKKEADASNHAKSEFLANMSHELRTPLNSIIGFSDVLKMEMFGELGSPKYKDYAGDINQSGTHLLELINEILDVSKIEAGALSLDEQSFNLQQIVEECVAMVSERARQADLTVTTEFSDDLPNLIADPLRVKQMILNLLTNSVKFTPKHGTVHISVHSHPDAGMEIEVVDNGIGIDEKFLEQVLQPFGQADKDASLTSQEGTGLGLPLVKMLIELHGGSMKLTSIKGQGTQVRLRLSKERVVH